MKKIITILLAVILLTSCEDPRPIKVACIGDSITFGSTIINNEDNSYPAQLQKMMGKGYDIQNFGVSGSTAINGNERAYVGKDAFRDMMNFAPDVLFLKLGTNDSNIALRDQTDRFEECYNAIIDSVYKVSHRCSIVLLTPIKAHNPISQWGIDSTYLTESIVPRIKQIAYDRSLEVIDLHPMFDKYEEYLIPDKVHPSALGAAKIARRLYELLALQTVNYSFDNKLKEPISFHGYKCYEFEYEGNFSRVAVPNIVAKGKPWIMRARFWGDKNFYAADVALLERGFHILFTDVTDLFGSPEAVGKFSKFIDYAIDRGLNSKCVIEALSRGGLVAYNYAAQYPDKVAMVYADAPVLDIASWPVGYNENSFITKKLLTAYGFQDVDEAREYNLNPIDRTTEIAKGGFDMLHVCGDADDVVPMEDNTLPFIQKVEAAGGKVKLIVKDGVGHHPHALANPDPIVEQILISTGQFISPTTVPTPGAEYRQMADWVTISEEISELTAANKYDILLLGNSIIQGFGSNRKLVRYQPGCKPMDETFPSRSWLSAGIAGDRTEHLLYRILNGGYGQCNPEYIVIAIGINNLFSGEDSAESTFDGIVACVEAIEKMMPHSRIILYGTLPAQDFIDECDYISQALSSYPWSSAVTYVDPFDIFASDRSHIDKQLYHKDLLHINAKGYIKWCENIKQIIDKN